MNFDQPRSDRATGPPGIALRAAILYVALTAIMHPDILGLFGALLAGPVRLVTQPFAGMLGLAEYPIHAQLAFRIVVAVTAGTIWWSATRRHHGDRTMLAALIVELRLVLAAGMISYGLRHLLAVSTPWPSQADWIRPIREMDAHEFLTIWIGSSPLQKSALGLSELTAGLLLVSRQTATFGALLAFAVLGNEAMTQLSFGDLRVGRYWLPLELAAMAAAVLVADLRRLLGALLFRERSVPGVPPAPAWPDGWMTGTAAMAKPIAMALVILANVPVVLLGIDGRYRSPLAGVYHVDEFTLDGQPVPTGQGAARWRWIAIDNCARFAIRTVGESQHEGAILITGGSRFTHGRVCARETATPSGALTLIAPNSLPPSVSRPSLAGSLRYLRSSDGAVDLEGSLNGSTIKARLRRLPDSAFRVFHYLTDARL